ncbi:hypothetical protein BC828DRAFT_372081 [Blastocladiella britannica]|nr:hypothetical protein BC828DRAFT_372081 [Blastocladiella britannica]
MSSPAAFQMDMQALGISDETVAAIADPIGRLALGTADKSAWGLATSLGFDLQPPALLAPPTPSCSECGLAQTADSVAYATGRAQCAGCYARLLEKRALSLHLDDVALDVYRQLTDVDSTWTAADLAREHDRFLDLGMVIQNGSGSSAEFYSVGAESDAAKLGHILHAAYPAAYAADFKARFNAAVADTYRAPAEKALPALPAAPRVTVSIGADAAAASAPAVALNVLTASPLEAGFFKSAKAAAVASDLIAADPAAAVAAYEAHVRALASSNGTEPKSESSLVRAVTLAHLLRIESFEQDIAELVGADKAAGIAAELRREVLEDISDVDTTAVAPTGTRSAITLGSLVATLPQLLAVLAEAVQEYTPTPSVAYERVLDNTTVLTREDGAKELYSFQFSQAHMLPHIEHIARGDAYHQYCTTHFDGVVGMLFALPAAPVPEKAPRLVVALATAGQAVVVERSLEVEAAPLVSADQVREFIAYVKPLLAKQTGPIALADVQTYTAEYRSHQGDTAFQLISLVHSMLSARYSRDHVALEDGQDVNGVELTADLNRRLASLRAVLDGVNADNDATAAAARYSRAMKDAVAVTAEDGSKYLYSIAPATPALLVAHLVHLSEPEAYKTFALVQFGTVTDLLVSSEAAFAPVEVVATEDASIEVTEDLSRDLEIVAAALLPAATPRILVDVSSAAAPATAAAAAHADGATETAPITVADVEAFKSHWLANEHEKRFTNLIFALNAIQRFQQWVTLPQAILPPPDVAVVHQVAKALGPNSASLPDAFLAASFLNAVASDADVSKWEHDTGLAWELDISNTYHCNKCQGTITLRSNTEQCLVCHEPLLGSDFAVSMFQKVPAFLVAVDELKRANAAQIVPTYAEWLVNVLLVSDQAGARQLYSIAPLTPEVSAGHLVHTQNGAAYRATMLAKTGGVATLFAPLATKPKAAASAAPRPVSVAATPLPSPVQSPIPAPRAIVIAPRPISRPTTPVKRDMDPVISLNPAALANGFALSNVDAFVIKPARDAAAAGTVEKVLGGEVTAASIDRHWRLLRMLLQIETSHYPALIVRSESRYLKWLTMVSETGKTHLIPPVDVALIAHVHAQFPERQRADLVGLFGETAADALMQLSVLSHEPAQFQQEIDAESEARWESYTGEPYLYHHAKAATAYLVSCPACSTISPASQAAIVSIKSEPNVTLPCGVCEVASDLMALRKTNRGIAAFSLNFVAQVGVWRSRMHKYLNESNQINAADATKQYRDYVRLSTEITLANGVTEVYSMVDSSASVQIGHATHLQFSGAYRKTVLGHFGHAGVTFVKVEEPLPLQPMEDDRRSSFMNIPIPPVPVDSAADVTAATVAVGTRDPNVRKDRSRALSLGTVSSVFEPVPDFSMRPEQLVAFQRLCAALLASPEFAFADDKAADQYWARAEARYLSYMRLMEHTVVEGHALPLPPLDVMTMWLVHIMDSHRYVEDLVRIFGDVKLLKFGFPVEKLDMFLQVNGAGAVMSGAAWKEFVPTSHADTWTTFTGQPFVLDAATVAAEWEMVCPFCRHDQKVAAPLYAEMRTGSRMLFCESCQKFMTPATISAWRLVEDLRKAEKGQGHVGGTLFNFARGKIDYKLAHTVHKLLFFTHDKTITEVLEARLNERDVVNPWKELDLAAILHDYVHAAVEKEYDGKAKELAKKADIVTGKILSYYQNVVTPLSLDLLQARTTWFKLTREVLDHIGEPFGDKEAQTIIDRYTKFMGLLEERRRKTSGTAAGASGDRYKGIVPAVDILLAHRCHLLDPVVYQKYCQSRFGKLMDFSRFTSKAELTAEYHDMAVLWTQKYSTPFDLPFQKPKPAKKKGLKKVLGLFGFGRK